MWPRPNQLLLFALIAIAGVMAWQHQQRLFEDQGRLTVEKSGDAALFSWNSSIELPMARRLSEAFEKSKGEVKRIVIDLNSPGGSLYEGREVIKVIDRMKQTHQVETHVGAKRICLSMCVPIYLQGQRRLASKSARFMFHEPFHADYFTGEEVKKPEFERKYFARQFFEQYFTNSQMDPVWRAQLEKEWKGREIWKTGRQLHNEKSNIVTELF